MKKLFCCLLLICFSNLNAQKFELGKVSIKELEEKAHPTDTSAVAAILFEIGNSYFNDYATITKVITRIKIYKKEGYEWANKIVPHFVDETVSISDAITYNLVNGEIEKTKLKNDGIFDEKINRYVFQKKITMPNVKVGSVIEFEYQIRNLGYSTPKDWYFQKSIPVNYSEYEYLIPNALIINKQLKGYIFPKVITEGKYNNDTSTKYILKNIPAMKDESFVNNINNYRASVSFELAMVNIPGRFYKEYSTSWEKVVKTIYDRDDFGSELNKTGYFENDITNLLNGIDDQNEKINIIYNFVKNKVKWDDYLGYSTNDGIRQAYKNGTGNVAEINLMLTAMLRFANIDANPVLVSTRDNGITYFPNLSAFNYVISAVEINEGLILLDATEKNALPNILPIRDLNWFGRLIRKDGTSAQVNLTPTNTSRDIVSVMATINTDGSVEGKAREQHLDYNAFTFREIYGDLAQESYLEKLEKNRENIEISDYTVTGKKEITEPVVEGYSFKHNNSVEIIGDKMYFSPMLFFAEKENPFKQETREYPVDFIYPNQEKYMINITIPDGYIVETLPKSVSIPMSDNILGLKYILSNTENKIQLSLNFDVNTAIISSDYYDELKAVYNEIIKKETEKIVLKKI